MRTCEINLAAAHRLESFTLEDPAILQAGLISRPYITDDAGARHARSPGITTQIGGRFAVFRTRQSKSRLNFLSLLRAGCDDNLVAAPADKHCWCSLVPPTVNKKAPP